MSDESFQLPPLARANHAAHCNRCLAGLPNSQVDLDSSRVAIVFYCLGSLDLLGMLTEKTTKTDREHWIEWIWEQQTKGLYGTGFRPSSYMTPQRPPNTEEEYSEYNTPHLIMTYTALLSLAILRDDFSRLDRSGMLKFIQSCQREDGSFSTIPASQDSDLRPVYCAFAISHMLDDWSAIDIERAVKYIGSCRAYEGGYGQSPSCEALGGTTYLAMASLQLVSRASKSLPACPGPLSPVDREKTIQWLIHNQDASGGFCGRTGKVADTCYCFWCGAALQILGAGDLVDTAALGKFLSRCQFKYGGIAKAPGEHPDPYHTYLALAAICMYPPQQDSFSSSSTDSWVLGQLDPLLNARWETSQWARQYISGKY